MNVQEIGHCHIFTVIEGEHVGSGEIEVDATPVNPCTYVAFSSPQQNGGSNRCFIFREMWCVLLQLFAGVSSPLL